MKTPAPHCKIRVSTCKPREQRTTYGLSRALSSQALDLAIAVDLVVLENGQLGLLPLVLDLLWGRVDLLLSLLGATSQTQDKMER